MLGGFDALVLMLLQLKSLLSASCLSGRLRIADAVLVLVAFGTLARFQPDR